MSSKGLLRQVAATFTLSVEIGPRSLTPVSVKAPMAMDNVPDPFPEFVYLIYPSEPDHVHLYSQHPLAAAFVLKVPNPEDPSQSNLFLVTARHAVDPRWSHCATENPRSIELRLNRSIGGVSYETVQLQSDSKSTFFTPSDPTVDLALIPFDSSVITNLGDYSLLEISSNDLITSSDLTLLRKNLPVRIAGYPDSFAQGLVRYPTRNFGSISEMRDDVTEVQCSAYDLGLKKDQGVQGEPGRSPRHMWFINAHAAEGLVGAPVFVDLERVAGQGRVRVLLGIQSGSWSQKDLVGITPLYLLGDAIRSASWRRAYDRTLLPGSSKPGNRRINSRDRVTNSR